MKFVFVIQYIAAHPNINISVRFFYFFLYAYFVVKALRTTSRFVNFMCVEPRTESGEGESRCRSMLLDVKQSV